MRRSKVKTLLSGQDSYEERGGGKFVESNGLCWKIECASSLCDIGIRVYILWWWVVPLWFWGGVVGGGGGED